MVYGIGGLLAAVGAYIHGAARQAWGRPMLVLGGLLLVPAAVSAVYYAAMSVGWSLSGSLQSGVRIGGSTWSLGWLGTSAAVLATAALAAVAVIAARKVSARRPEPDVE